MPSSALLPISDVMRITGLEDKKMSNMTQRDWKKAKDWLESQGIPYCSSPKKIWIPRDPFNKWCETKSSRQFSSAEFKV